MKNSVKFLVFFGLLSQLGLVEMQDVQSLISQTPKEKRPEVIAALLKQNPAMMDKVWAILQAAVPFQAGQGSNPVAVSMEMYVLDMIPVLLKDPDFLDIMGIVGDEMFKVDVTSIPPQYQAKYALSQMNYVRTVQRILMRNSARDLLGPPGVNLSYQCYSEFADFMDSMVVFSPWALHMFDAFGKPSSGIQKGSTYFVGSWDECYTVNALIPDNTTVIRDPITKEYVLGNITRNDTVTYQTRFCKANFGLPDSFIEGLGVDTRGVSLKVTLGLCMPATCNAKDVGEMFKLKPFKTRDVHFEGAVCYGGDDQDIVNDKRALAVVGVLAFFGFLVVVGTALDVAQTVFTKTKSTGSNPEKLGIGRAQTAFIQNKASEYKHLEEQSEIAKETKPRSNSYELQPMNDKVSVETFKKIDSTEIQDEEKGKVNAAYANESPTDHIYKEITEENGEPSGNVHAANPGNVVPVVVAAPTKSAQPSRPPREAIVVRCLKAFSLYSNIPKILNAKGNAAAIGCIHGIRFLSITWVILAHTYNYGIISASDTPTLSNLVDAGELIERWTFRGVQGANYAVDSFFVISGCLVVWLQLKEMKKPAWKTPGYWFMYYFHRFWRLTPVYMVVVIWFGFILRYMATGPLWPKTIVSADNCREYWWTNLLYINNLVHRDNLCMGWSWYLSNDMQFYVIAPVFIIYMHVFPVIGLLMTVALLFGGIAATAVAQDHYDSDILHTKDDHGGYWNNVYVVPWCRVTAYAVGMLLGWIIFYRERKPFNKAAGILAWFIAAVAALFVVYIPQTQEGKHGERWPREVRTSYEALGRVIWSICVSWVIFACYNYRGGVVNSILSWSGFIPLSRLSYSCYLIHPLAMMLYVYSKKTLLYLSDYDVIYLYVGHMFMAFGAAFVLSLCFEAPFMALEKIILRRK